MKKWNMKGQDWNIQQFWSKRIWRSYEKRKRTAAFIIIMKNNPPKIQPQIVVMKGRQ
jgi:hypothetical protein